MRIAFVLPLLCCACNYTAPTVATKPAAIVNHRYGSDGLHLRKKPLECDCFRMPHSGEQPSEAMQEWLDGLPWEHTWEYHDDIEEKGINSLWIHSRTRNAHWEVRGGMWVCVMDDILDSRVATGTLFAEYEPTDAWSVDDVAEWHDEMNPARSNPIIFTQ